MPENNPARSQQLVTIAVLVIAVAAVFFVGRSFGDDGNDSAGAASSTETFGVVTGGEASATGTPDQLTFNAAVSNTRSSTAAALAATNHDVRAVTIAARKNGVVAKDIQTQSLSVRPKYDYRPRSQGGTRLVGYTSTQRVKIKVRKLDKAGRTIGGVATAAGNAVSVSGISLSISNQDELIAKARAAAVKKSRAAAAALARAAGREVGDLEYVEEVVPQGYDYDESARLDALSFTKDAAALATSVPISPAKQQLSVTVKVRWALAD
jgi:uncharacterized protein YggE